MLSLPNLHVIDGDQTHADAREQQTRELTGGRDLPHRSVVRCTI